ncbi:MAG: hypothetical protein OXI10_06970, partial [Gammaproteobacteria bacterium]|nr:hypothetical protein [Gammaproteobacteria bacterium]
MADDSGRIQCPNCGQEIDVNDVLAHRIENRLRGELEAKHREQEEQVRARMEEVGRQQAALQEAQERQARETEEAIALGIKEREAELAQQLKCR